MPLTDDELRKTAARIAGELCFSIAAQREAAIYAALVAVRDESRAELRASDPPPSAVLQQIEAMRSDIDLPGAPRDPRKAWNDALDSVLAMLRASASPPSAETPLAVLIAEYQRIRACSPSDPWCNEPTYANTDHYDGHPQARDEVLGHIFQAAVSLRRPEDEQARLQRHRDALAGLVGLIQLNPQVGERLLLQANHRYVEAAAVLSELDAALSSSRPLTEPTKEQP